MPKQQLKIEQFHGGLNTDSDPRDIADNEFSALKGISISSIGTIKSAGDANQSSVSGLSSGFDLSNPDSVRTGYGLF